MKNRLALTRTGMRSSRLLSCFAAVFISTVMPDYSDALRYGLPLALLAAYALLCLGSASAAGGWLPWLKLPRPCRPLA